MCISILNSRFSAELGGGRPESARQPLRKHCTCRQIRENGSPRPPKTTQDHGNHRHHRNRSKTLHRRSVFDWAEKTAPRDHPRRPKTTEITEMTKITRNDKNHSKTLHLGTNPGKRRSGVISWPSKTLHLSTNPRKRHSKTLHLSTNPRKRLSGVTGRSDRLLRSHWALESAAPGPLGARSHCCRAGSKTAINCAQF